jgi:hypothetical protein
MAAVLLFLWGLGAFSGVSPAKYDQVQRERQALTQANEKLLAEGRYYFDQAQQYRKKFPKTAASFPKYVAPATPAPAVE